MFFVCGGGGIVARVWVEVVGEVEVEVEVRLLI
jgi:hypothetical protein